MVVADIALRRLAPKARAAAERLIALDKTPATPDFITASAWADDTKTRETGPWHYIDLYFRADGRPTDLKPDAENVVWAIHRFSEVLKNRGASSRDRAEALRYLIHFVGDIQQPLHCSSRVTDDQPRGDAGGNRFYLGSPSPARRASNLHSIWDAGCGVFPTVDRPLSGAGRAKIDQIADRALAELDGSTRKAAIRDMDPMSWAIAGHLLARKYVYSLPEHTDPSAGYLSLGQKLALKQVALGGLRLAALLNQLLG